MSIKIIDHIVRWLNKPFPVIESTKDKLLIALGSGFVVVCILSAIKPFGIASQGNLFLFLFGFGVIDFVITFLNLLLLPRAFPKTLNVSNFTTGANFMVILWILLNIALVNYLYGDYLIYKTNVVVFDNKTGPGLVKWLTMTFSIGVFPVIFALYYIEKRFFLIHHRKANNLNKEIITSKTKPSGNLVQLRASKETMLNIDANDLICVKAEGGNYSTIFWHDTLGTNSEMIRMTLTSFIEDTSSIDNYIRCHKSYVINLNKVISYDGNARSIMVQLEGLDFSVPLSRSFPRKKLPKNL